MITEYSFNSRCFSIANKAGNGTGSERARGAGPLGALALAAALWSAGCVPAPFTFEETPGSSSSGSGGSGGGGEGGGGAGGAGGVGGAGGAPDPCGPDNVCSASPPVGWKGHYVITVEPFPGGGPGACPGGAQPMEYYAAPASAGCTGCPCSVSGTTCAVAALGCYYMDSVCMVTESAYIENDIAGCTNFATLPADDNLLGSCQLLVESKPTVTGTCSAGTSELLEENPWNDVVYACPPVGADVTCGPGQTCAPAAGGENQYTCIAKAGYDDCPGDFAHEIQAFEGGFDDRGCEPCSCGMIDCNNGSFEVYDGMNCTDGGNDVVTFDELGCAELSGYFDQGTASVKTTPPSGEAECFGGEATGAVNTSGAIKFCCN